MNSNGFTTTTAKDSPDLVPAMQKHCSDAWPVFMHQSKLLNEHFRILYEDYPEYQLAMLNEDSSLVAAANSFPMRYTGQMADLPAGGLEWAFERSALDLQAEREPNLLCAFQIVVDRQLRGKRLSGRMVEAMIAVGRKHELTDLIAPVRPNLKTNYPHEPMTGYIKRVRPDGFPFDDWLRVHVRLGGERLHVCAESMRIEGTVAEWSEWTGQTFETSGAHVVPFAVQPVTVDLEKDHGLYLDANVWVRHRL